MTARQGPGHEETAGRPAPPAAQLDRDVARGAPGPSDNPLVQVAEAGRAGVREARPRPRRAAGSDSGCTVTDRTPDTLVLPARQAPTTCLLARHGPVSPGLPSRPPPGTTPTGWPRPASGLAGPEARSPNPRGITPLNTSGALAILNIWHRAPGVGALPLRGASTAYSGKSAIPTACR